MIKQESRLCDKCGNMTTGFEEYKDKIYCSRCYKKSVEYDSDALRKKYDIRLRDPKTLTWYQQAQLKVIKGYETDEPQIS